MDADPIRRLKPDLTRSLQRFNACFARRDTRAHFPVDVAGQLSDLPAKRCAPIAGGAGVAPRTLQEFLAHDCWEEERRRDRLQEIVIHAQAGPHAMGILDATSDVKQGNKTPGVQRQWCGTVGRRENCSVTVPLAEAAGNFPCLLDGELFLPERCSQARPRCRAAGIPEALVSRPKGQIGLE